eukprot:COSAG02_NODE_53840_length_299_cov_1.015000_1_plen_34_part_10
MQYRQQGGQDRILQCAFSAARRVYRGTLEGTSDW